MWLSWRQRLEREPRLWDYSNWPLPYTNALSKGARQGFLRNQLIVASVLKHEPLTHVAKRFQLTTGRISQIMTRCLAGEESESPALNNGLLLYKNLVPKRRHSPLPQLGSTNHAPHAFGHLLEIVPGLKSGLDDMLVAALRQSNYAERVSAHAFHGRFKLLLSDAHWPYDRYPYTYMSVAYESLRKYLHRRQLELVREHRRKNLSSNPLPRLQQTSLAPLDVIEIDEHILDLHTALAFRINDEEIVYLRLARGCVLVARDVGSTSYLGYHLAATQHPTQDDLLALLENCITPWRPRELTTPGFAYIPGGGFPSGLPGGFPISFGLVRLDNAWMHSANSVVTFLCDTCGAGINFGRPEQPNARWMVESAFRYIEDHVGHRFDSTTGSHPMDPIREPRKNRKHAPLLYWHSLDEALSVVMADYNRSPCESLHNRSPLEVFSDAIEHQFIRYIPSQQYKTWQPFLSEFPVFVRENAKDKSVHINFAYSKYTGSCLYSARIREPQICIRVDRRDLRVLEAYTLSGEHLGELRAPSTWQRYPFSMATRKAIKKLSLMDKRFKIEPVETYFKDNCKNKGTEKGALKLMQIFQEITRGSDKPYLTLDQPNDAPTSEVSRAKREQSTPVSWSPNVAKYKDDDSI